MYSAPILHPPFLGAAAASHIHCSWQSGLPPHTLVAAAAAAEAVDFAALRSSRVLSRPQIIGTPTDQPGDPRSQQ